MDGELRRPGDDTVVGHVAVNWRNLADSLEETPLIGGPIAASARFLQVVSGTRDPATGLGEIDIQIDETVFGQPVSCSARPEARANQWIVWGAKGDWWDHLTVFRAGVPIPAQFPEP